MKSTVKITRKALVEALIEINPAMPLHRIWAGNGGSDRYNACQAIEIALQKYLGIEIVVGPLAIHSERASRPTPKWLQQLIFQLSRLPHPVAAVGDVLSLI